MRENLEGRSHSAREADPPVTDLSADPAWVGPTGAGKRSDAANGLQGLLHPTSRDPHLLSLATDIDPLRVLVWSAFGTALISAWAFVIWLVWAWFN